VVTLSSAGYIARPRALRARRLSRLAGALLLLQILIIPRPGQSQVLDLTIDDVGIAIGDKPRMTGLRINFRDDRLEEVTGMNITLWTPHDPASGTVNGIALGLPLTGARRINGLATGIFGAGADESITGIGVGPVGVGAGDELRGIMVGGIGVGSGGGLTGIGVGGIGVGSGGPMTGIFVGGIGTGSGDDIKGVAIGGIGVGGGGRMMGLAIGGIGVGSGGGIKGVSIGGIGVGSGGNITGLSIGGVGVGSGGRLRGVSIGGVGVGAPELSGLVISGIGAGGEEVHAIVLTGAYFNVARGGTFRGASLAGFNRVRGTQRGLTIGLINYARTLRGVQVGLINVSDNGGRRRVLPVFSMR
jgi:hypothetical protein